MLNINQVLDKLQNSNFKFEQSRITYNPLEKFVEYVSNKEIIHSMILEDILKENGSHGLGNKFIQNFFKKFFNIDYSQLSYIDIKREKKVPRQVTIGEDRSIDIFIEYAYINGNKDISKEPENKNAIIIENKLNNAYYQEKQLLDYYKAIKEDGFQNIDILCLHKYKTDFDNQIEDIEGCTPIIKYPQDLASWLLDSISINDLPKAYTLVSYITLLNNLNSYNTMKENVDILFNLDKKTFDDVKAIAEAYNELMDNRLAVLKKEWLPKFCPEAEAQYKSRTKNIEIWNKSNYSRNHLFIVLWERLDGFTLYLASDDKNYNSSQYIEEANFQEIADTNYGYIWYISKDSNTQNFKYPQKEGIERMMLEIKRLLNILAK